MAKLLNLMFGGRPLQNIVVHLGCYSNHLNILQSTFSIPKKLSIRHQQHFHCNRNVSNLPFNHFKMCEISKYLSKPHMFCYATDCRQFTLTNDRFRAYVGHLEKEFKEMDSSVRDNKQQQRFLVLGRIVEHLNEVRNKYAELEDLVEMEKDDSIKEMVQEEKQICVDAIKELEETIVQMLCPGRDEHDNCDIILEVECGAGGQESMIFAQEILDLYQKYAQYRGWSFNIINSDGDSGTYGKGVIRKASVSITGSEVYRRMKYEGGIHRVKRVPVTESGGRVHTSTVSVAILFQPTEIDMTLDPKDLKIDTFKSSGPGGQNAQKTDSAVRVKHIPTGITCECQSTRSQFQNKEIALRVVKARLMEKEQNAVKSKVSNQRKIQVGGKSRSERIRTFVYLQDMVVDHRLDKTVRNIDNFLSGGDTLDTVIGELLEEADFESLELKLEEFEQTHLKSSKSKKVKG